MDYDWGLIILDIILTFIFFMIGPFIRFHKKSHLYTIKEIKKFNILNSVIVQVIIMIIILAFNDQASFNFVPAILYYFANQWLWTRKIKDTGVEENDTKDDDIKEDETDDQNNEEENAERENNKEEKTSDIMELLNKK